VLFAGLSKLGAAFAPLDAASARGACWRSRAPHWVVVGGARADVARDVAASVGARSVALGLLRDGSNDTLLGSGE
jgi:hypothetical protein